MPAPPGGANTLGAMREQIAARQTEYQDYAVERMAAYAANPMCVECGARIIDPDQAVYLQFAGRFSCRGDCTVRQLTALWATLTDNGAHMPRQAVSQ